MTIFFWQPMRPEHLSGVFDLANRAHQGLPEREAVFAERLSLHARGCLVLAGEGALVEGYALSHPIRRFEPPALDTLLGSLKEDADDYYLHDLVVATERRGAGHAAAGVRQILEIAEAYQTSSLVSVYGTATFWMRFGFRPSSKDMGKKLAAYGRDAVLMIRENSTPAVS